MMIDYQKRLLTIMAEESNRLIERTGSLPMRLNSRMRLTRPEVFRVEEATVGEVVSMIVLI